MSEKTKRFLRDTAVLSAAALLVRFVSILSNRYITARIGAAGMGLCALVASVAAFATTVATAGVGFAVSRLVPEAEARGDTGAARKITRAALLLSLLIGGAAGALLVLLAPAIGTHLLGDARTVPALAVLGFSLPFVSLSSALSGYFLAVRRSKRSGIVRVAEQLLRFPLSLLLISLFAERGLGAAALAVVSASAIAEMLSCLVLTVCYFRTPKPKTPVSGILEPLTLRLLLATALPILFSSLIRSALTSLEHLLIPIALTRFGGDRESALASYGTLTGMALPITLLPMAVFSSAAGLLVPECAEKGRGAVKNIADRALSKTLSIGILLGGLLLLLSAPLGKMSGLGAPLTDYLRLLAPCLPLMLLDHVTDAILRGIGEQLWSMWVNIADSLLSILLVLLLVPPLGARGYIAVILLAECFNLALSFGRLTRVSGATLDLARTLLPALLISLTAGGLGFLFLPLGAPAALAAYLLPVLPFALRLRSSSACGKKCGN